MAVIVRQLNVERVNGLDIVKSIDGPGTFYIPQIFDVSRFDSWSIMFRSDQIIGNVYLQIWTSHLPDPDRLDPNDWVIIKNFVLNEETKNTLVEWDNASLRWLAYRIDADIGEAVEGAIYLKGNGDN